MALDSGLHYREEQKFLLESIKLAENLNAKAKESIINLLENVDSWRKKEEVNCSKSSDVNNTNNDGELDSKPLISNPDQPNAQDSMILEYLVNQAPYVLFLKGTAEKPTCKHSRKMVELLNSKKIEFAHFNVLSETSVRNAIKKYSNFPTYPQLFSQGKLVGGVDIVEQMIVEDMKF